MLREHILQLMETSNWFEVMQLLKDNKNFNELSKDPIFNHIFEENFANEFLNSSKNHDENYITELKAIYDFHFSKNHNFKLSELKISLVANHLATVTRDISVAYRFPNLEISKEIIEIHEKESNETIKKTEENYSLSNKFRTTEHIPESNKNNFISIFKSPQELELYIAAKSIFPENIILPNCALSAVLSNDILKNLNKKHISLFLTTTVDLVIVSPKNYHPQLFIELDSSFHDKPEQKQKDLIKNELITNAGGTLFRIRKKTGLESEDDYKEFINVKLKDLIENKLD